MRPLPGLGLGLSKIRYHAAALSNLQLWLEADTITDHADGEGIVSGDHANPEWAGGDWRDQSGSNNHPYSDTVTHEPLWFGTIVNTLPGARYDGVNDYSQSKNPVFAENGDFTLFAVLVPYDSGFDANWLSGGDPTDGSFQLLDDRQDASNGKLWLSMYTAGDVLEDAKQVGTFAYGSPLLVQVKVEGASAKAWLNGTEVINFTLAGARAGTDQRNLFLAAMRGITVDGFFGKLDLGAALAFNVATLAEVDAYWNNYLTTKYGPFA